jgi:hypothetical protein
MPVEGCQATGRVRADSGRRASARCRSDPMRSENLAGGAAENGETLVQIGFGACLLAASGDERVLALKDKEHGRGPRLELALLARVLLSGEPATLGSRFEAGPPRWPSRSAGAGVGFAGPR